jgi:hypothetical protein
MKALLRLYQDSIKALKVPANHTPEDIEEKRVDVIVEISMKAL